MIFTEIAIDEYEIEPPRMYARVDRPVAPD
jgi:hypothetical protein